jgi:hypothetical protein
MINADSTRKSLKKQSHFISMLNVGAGMCRNFHAQCVSSQSKYIEWEIEINNVNLSRGGKVTLHAWTLNRYSPRFGAQRWQVIATRRFRKTRVKSCFTHLSSTFIQDISREVYPRRIESRVIAPPRRRSNSTMFTFATSLPCDAFTLDEHQTTEFTAESATSKRHALFTFL